MSEAASEDDDKLGFYNAILIAIITVIAALIAWRASVAGDATGDFDYGGLKAVVAAEEVRTMATVESLVHAQAYASYRRYDETVEALGDEIDESSGARVAELQKQRREADVLLDNKLSMFPNKYIERTSKEGDSSYSTKREVGQYVSNKKRTRDLVPDDDFSSAESYRGKTEKLLWGVVILTVALVMLTLVETLEGAARKACFGMGLLLGVAGTVFSLMMEVAKYE